MMNKQHSLSFLIVCALCAMANASDDQIKIQESFNDLASIPEVSDPYGEYTLSKEESGFTRMENGRSLMITDVSEEGTAKLVWNLELESDARVLISFDYSSLRTSGGNHGIELRGAGGQGILLVLAMFDQSGMVYHDGSERVSLGAVLSPRYWYRIYLVLPPPSAAEKTFDLVVKDTTGLEVINQKGLKFRNNISDYESLWFTFNNPAKVRGSSYLIDNLVVAAETAEN